MTSVNFTVPGMSDSAALDVVYDGVNGDHRKAIARFGEIDPVSEDLLIEHSREFELFQWFVRARLESSTAKLPTADARTEKGAAKAARKSSWLEKLRFGAAGPVSSAGSCRSVRQE